MVNEGEVGVEGGEITRTSRKMISQRWREKWTIEDRENERGRNKFCMDLPLGQYCKA